MHEDEPNVTGTWKGCPDHLRDGVETLMHSSGAEVKIKYKQCLNGRMRVEVKR
jgi:hypothetical protein